jgi:CTP:molybdopterin cytidylyltransferase MocA
MLDWLLDLYAPFVDGFVLVVHPSFESDVRARASDRVPPIECVLQPAPTGMLDAILAAHDLVLGHGPDGVWITWCDQLAVDRRTLARLHELSAPFGGEDLVLPTVKTSPPYIHLVRDAAGVIDRVLHRREGDAMPATGESDMGLFGLSAKAYERALPAFASAAPPGDATHERNFLPFIPWLSRRGRVATFPACDPIEALGVNTPEDLERVEKHLRSRPDGS